MNSFYDYDGYMLIGTANLTDDPANVMSGSTVSSSGYIYMCTKDGKDTAGVTCAYTRGTAQEMATNKTIGTVTSTQLTKAADFNTVVSG